jgi:hypothetical protein
VSATPYKPLDDGSRRHTHSHRSWLTEIIDGRELGHGLRAKGIVKVSFIPIRLLMHHQTHLLPLHSDREISRLFPPV